MSKYTMGPCPMCTSSDAYAIYDDGVGTCFSCGKSRKENGNRMEHTGQVGTSNDC